MIKYYVESSLESVTALGWAFLGLVFVGVVVFNLKMSCDIKKRILWSVVIMYVGIILCMTVVGRKSTGDEGYELTALWSWRSIICAEHIGEVERFIARQILANVLMFVPLGFMMRFVWKVKFYKAFLLNVVFSFTIELLQLLFEVGFFEWDDVLHNTLGYLLGTGLACAVKWIRVTMEKGCI